jgi:hypothetical protein
MFAFAWASRLLEMLLGVATARVQNGQPKIVCAL